MNSRWGFPLFGKELREQSARRRTYIIRILYVSLLCGLMLMTLGDGLSPQNPLSGLGQGTRILDLMVTLQFYGILLFLPAMSCGVFTVEKERNTLPLLFQTRLGPWTIIIEKLLSRMLPMVMFLCCSLPLMTFTYSMGGLNPSEFVLAGYLLFVAVFQTACVGIMCSAYAHSTSAALIQTYLVLFLMWFLPALVAEFSPRTSYEWAIYSRVIELGLFPAGIWELYKAYRGPVPNPFINITPLLGVPAIMAGAVCLLVARFFLYRRAHVTSSNPLLKLFRLIDRFFFWLHGAVKFDVKLVKESDSLPADKPIAWRELSKRALGQFRYLVRILVPLLFPVIFLAMFTLTASANDWQRPESRMGLSMLILFLSGICLSLICITAANTIPAERTRQTWDVLRSIPLPAADMLKQKLSAVSRLQWVCAIPAITAIAMQGWWRYQLLVVGLQTARASNQPYEGSRFFWAEYLIGGWAALIVYTELVKWISMWCGLVIRSAMRAILTSVVLVTLIALFPTLLAWSVTDRMWQIQPDTWEAYFMMLSPALFTTANEFADLRQISAVPFVPALIHLLPMIGLLWLIRLHLFRQAEWYLGRSRFLWKGRHSERLAPHSLVSEPLSNTL